MRFRGVLDGFRAPSALQALLSSTRLLPVEGLNEFCVCNSPVVVGAGSTVSHAAAVVAAETGRESSSKTFFRSKDM